MINCTETSCTVNTEGACCLSRLDLYLRIVLLLNHPVVSFHTVSSHSSTSLLASASDTIIISLSIGCLPRRYSPLLDLTFASPVQRLQHSIPQDGYDETIPAMPKRRAIDSEGMLEEAARKSSGHKKSKKMGLWYFVSFSQMRCCRISHVWRRPLGPPLAGCLSEVGDGFCSTPPNQYARHLMTSSATLQP